MPLLPNHPIKNLSHQASQGEEPWCPSSWPQAISSFCSSPLPYRNIAQFRFMTDTPRPAPFYDGQWNLIYLPGIIMSGSVSKAKPSGWFQKQGSLNFQFMSISNTDGQPQRLYARVVGVEAAKGQALSIDNEGAMKATYSPIKRITSSLSLLGPSRGLADPSLDKTAFQRGGQGRKGIGLIGTGAARRLHLRPWDSVTTAQRGKCMVRLPPKGARLICLRTRHFFSRRIVSELMHLSPAQG